MLKDKCVFCSVYRDHGASVNTCTLLPSLDEYRNVASDEKRYNECCPCSYFLTLDDIRNNLDVLISLIVEHHPCIKKQ